MQKYSEVFLKYFTSDCEKHQQTGRGGLDEQVPQDQGVSGFKCLSCELFKTGSDQLTDRTCSPMIRHLHVRLLRYWINHTEVPPFVLLSAWIFVPVLLSLGIICAAETVSFQVKTVCDDMIWSLGTSEAEAVDYFLLFFFLLQDSPADTTLLHLDLCRINPSHHVQAA